MLSQKDQKKINSKLINIYKGIELSSNINFYSEEIFRIIDRFNKAHLKKKIKISEKTSVVICYGDSLIENNQKKLIKIFQNFYKKKLNKYFNTVHFLPFYPSSSDSGFAVKDHYKIDQRLGSWSDINNFSKKNLIMADIVINHDLINH